MLAQARSGIVLKCELSLHTFVGGLLRSRPNMIDGMGAFEAF